MKARNFQINIRLSEEEYRSLSRAAALCGIGRAAYVRMLLLERWRADKREEETSFPAR